MYRRSFVDVALSTAVLAILLVPAQVAAQERSAARLPADVVAQLAAAPDAPGASARLAEHFAAVAAQYDARAREHRAMAKAYRARPTPSEHKRPSAPDTAVHCDRLADRASEAAAAAGALAALYRGVPSDTTAPAAAAAGVTPDSGAAVQPPGTDVHALALTGREQEDHARMARHFRDLAGQLDREAREHRAMAVTYRTVPTGSESKRPGAPDTALHCERLAESSAKAAGEARTLAKLHAIADDQAKKAGSGHHSREH